MTPNENNLRRVMLPLSLSNIWEYAKQEWVIDHIEWLDRDEPPRTCTCEHYPIRELCFMKNRYTNHEALVGNVCVAKFLGIDSLNIFSGLDRIRADVNAATNVALAEYAHGAGLIDDWELGFLVNTARKRKLSMKQGMKRYEINRRLITQIRNPSQRAH